MDTLVILKIMEFVIASVVLMLLVLWPSRLCSELTDANFEAAYLHDPKCALEIQQNIELIKNVTQISAWIEYDTVNNRNITVRNERNELLFRRERLNFLCAAISIRSKFVDGIDLGSSDMIIPVIACTGVLLSLIMHMVGVVFDNCCTHKIYLIVTLVGWLVTALSLLIVSRKWDEGTRKYNMHFGALFPDLWRACHIIAWIYVGVNFAQICLAMLYLKIKIRFEKPSTRVTLVFSESAFDVDGPAYPLNEDWMNQL